jgi:hypothetical protein
LLDAVTATFGYLSVPARPALLGPGRGGLGDLAVDSDSGQGVPAGQLYQQ